MEGDSPCVLNSVAVDDFYPRPPGGGRPLGHGRSLCAAKFLSTPSGWRATTEQLYTAMENDISIHALRVEGDVEYNIVNVTEQMHFYPRPPGGGRLILADESKRLTIFLSTPSGWRATVHVED